MPQDLSPQALVGLLEWYRAAGVDACVEEIATDWLARGELPPGGELRRPDPAPPPLAKPAAEPVEATPAARSAPTARQFPTATPDVALASARAAAEGARSLDDLRRALETFDGCALKATARQLCFYRGAPRARIMIIGEAPGRDEDLAGKPFVGRAGQLLDKMLVAAGLSEADVHIANIVYWRPPGNRTPTPQEALICRPFLERQVELVAPEFVLLLGGAAAKHVLDVADGIMRLRGKWRDIELGRRRVRAMATLHPAYLLRSPGDKRKAWRDLLMLKEALGRTGTGP